MVEDVYIRRLQTLFTVLFYDCQHPSKSLNLLTLYARPPVTRMPRIWYESAPGLATPCSSGMAKTKMQSEHAEVVETSWIVQVNLLPRRHFQLDMLWFIYIQMRLWKSSQLGKDSLFVWEVWWMSVGLGNESVRWVLGGEESCGGGCFVVVNERDWSDWGDSNSLVEKQSVSRLVNHFLNASVSLQSIKIHLALAVRTINTILEIRLSTRWSCAWCTCTAWDYLYSPQNWLVWGRWRL